MRIAFDLISDLHVETWPGDFDWTGMGTSQFCIVTGDVARDPTILMDTLTHLGQCYAGVFYIDGNDEHKYNIDHIGENYRDLTKTIAEIENVVYLQDNVAVINGVAILGTNGWWTWDFDESMDLEQSYQWYRDKGLCQHQTPELIHAMAEADTQYLSNSIRKLQTYPDIRRIIVATHTVPGVEFVQHDIDLQGNYRINCMGNSTIRDALRYDPEGKVTHWVFGHYHGSVDRVLDGVRYVNNCRGRGDTDYKKSVFNPLRIEIEV